MLRGHGVQGGTRLPHIEKPTVRPPQPAGEATAGRPFRAVCGRRGGPSPSMAQQLVEAGGNTNKTTQSSHPGPGLGSVSGISLSSRSH